jgi:hypothetical protein
MVLRIAIQYIGLDKVGIRTASTGSLRAIHGCDLV